METNIGFKHNDHSALWGGENQGEQTSMSSSPSPPVVHSNVLLAPRTPAAPQSSRASPPPARCLPTSSELQRERLHPSFVWLPSQYWAQDSVCGTQDPPFYVSHSTLTSQPLPSPSGWGMLRKRQCCSWMNCPVNLMSTSTWPTLGEQWPTFSKLVQHLPSASCVPSAHPTQRVNTILISQTKKLGFREGNLPGSCS